MNKLARDGRLPQFIEARLSYAKIRDRTYEHIQIDSELIFNIIRHPGAWRNEAKMNGRIQTWVFDFTDLSLKELSNIDSAVAISVRQLMESKSEWEGTAAELLFELKMAAEILKINTKGNLWPKSSYILNRTLQKLKTLSRGVRYRNGEKAICQNYQIRLTKELNEI